MKTLNLYANAVLSAIEGANSNWDVAGNVLISNDGGVGRLNVNPGGTVAISQNLTLKPGARVRLQGGTLSAQSITLQGGDFQWTSGTLHTVTFNGNLVNAGGALAPGASAGSTTIIGNYTQQSSAKFDVEIGGPLVSAQHDFLNVTGTVLLGGELELTLIDSFVPNAQQSFIILNAGSLLSFFSNVTNGQRLATEDGVGSFLVHYGPTSQFSPNQIRLTDFQSTALPGDFNHDGAVDAADYVMWRKTDGSPDGYNTWRANFGQVVGSGSVANTMVPEPAAALLLVLGAAIGCWRTTPSRRQKQSN